MEVRGFEDLEVFQRAYRLALCDSPQSSNMRWPLRCGRASKSICVNLAEGYAKQGYSVAEFKRFVQMSVGSADEMRVWCRFCHDLGYIDAATWQGWRDEYQEIAKMLQGIIRSWK
jgi:four helix bundle protein